MKVFYVGNGKMIKEISKIEAFKCVGVYDLNLYILMEKPDIIIDFSHPDFFEFAIKKALEFDVPLLIGTTGYNNQQMAYLKEISNKIPVLKSANFCKGIITLKSLLTERKKFFNRYKKKLIEII